MTKPVIETPRGKITTTKTANGKLTAKLTWNTGFRPKWQGRYSAAQKYVDTQVLRLCDPYIPKDTGALIASGVLGTDIGSGTVKWVAPYAHRQYYLDNRKTTKSINPLGGSRWFDRAMVTHKQSIIRGAGRIAGGKVTWSPSVK